MKQIIYALLFAGMLNAWALPDGFELSVLTDAVPGARQMAEAPSSTIFVGSMRHGNLYAVVTNRNSQKPIEVVLVDSGLRLPSGLVLRGPDLYVGALNRIIRYPNIEETFRNNPEPEVVINNLPKDRWHGWKYLSEGPDGMIYFNVGAPCNICESKDPRYASILRMDPSNGETSVFAHGVRNSVGMAWHPETNQMWFSDNGRDWMGDDLPPEEINVATGPGQHFGYPYVHVGDIRDPKFGTNADISAYVAPRVKIQAHSAALGITFYTSDVFPSEYRNALFIAEHGSWNRSRKVGYRVSVVRSSNNQLKYEPFVDVWLKGEKVSGRPNDVLVSRDGSLLISDDYGGKIYRVTYSREPITDISE